MKTKTTGRTAYIVKAYYRDSAGNLAVMYNTWFKKSGAIKDYNEKVKQYGEDNVFAYKAKQCYFE